MKLTRLDSTELFDSDYDYLSEMPRIGKFRHDGVAYDLIVYHKENKQGNPHFHMHITGEPYNSDMCVRLDIPEYFEHSKHVGRLNSKGRRKLNSYLRTVNPRYGVTIWEALVDRWNEMFNTLDIDEMPNYENLPDKED